MCVSALQLHSASYVNNVFIPSTLTFLLAYAVAAAFLHVYDLAIATILLCFCEDFRYHSVDDASKSADHDEVRACSEAVAACLKRRLQLLSSTLRLGVHALVAAQPCASSGFAHALEPRNDLRRNSCVRNSRPQDS